MSEPEFVTAAEAARRAGVTESAVRGWLKTGKLIAEKRDGIWKIPIERLMGMLATDPPTVAHVRPSDDRTSSEAVGLISETLRVTTAALDRERTLSDGLRHQVDDLTKEVRCLQAEIKALLSGEHDSAIMRWVRTQMAPHEPPRAAETQPHDTAQAQQQKNILNNAPAPQSLPQTGSTTSLPQTGSTTSLPKPHPKISEFASKCVKLAQSGLTPEQIAENLTGSDKKYTASQVRMALKNR